MVSSNTQIIISMQTHKYANTDKQLNYPHIPHAVMQLPGVGVFFVCRAFYVGKVT